MIGVAIRDTWSTDRPNLAELTLPEVLEMKAELQAGDPANNTRLSARRCPASLAPISRKLARTYKTTFSTVLRLAIAHGLDSLSIDPRIHQLRTMVDTAEENALREENDYKLRWSVTRRVGMSTRDYIDYRINLPCTWQVRDDIGEICHITGSSAVTVAFACFYISVMTLPDPLNGYKVWTQRYLNQFFHAIQFVSEDDSQDASRVIESPVEIV